MSLHTPPRTGIVCDASLVQGRGSIKRDGYYHGQGEWQAMDLSTGELVVQSHIQARTTIMIAEWMAIVDSLRYLHEQQDRTTPVYNDNQTAVRWARFRTINTKLPKDPSTQETHYDIEDGLAWIRFHEPKNPIIWYNESVFGPNPADFGRK